MKAAYAVFALILVLVPLGLLAPEIDHDKEDLADFHPRNLGLPRKGEVTYANPQDLHGRPGLKLLQGDPGDLAYGSESATSLGTISPGDSITIEGRLNGWDENEFTLAEIPIYIFWNTNITTPASWVSSPPYNGITIENGTAAVASGTTNGTAVPDSGGIPVNYAYTGTGYFSVTFTVPDFDDPDFNVQIGNNTIIAYFLGNDKQLYYWEAGRTWAEVSGSVELGTTPNNATINPGDSVTFQYRATLESSTIGANYTTITFTWSGTTPNGTSINSTSSQTDSEGYVTFQVDTTLADTQFGTFTLLAIITALEPGSAFSISATNYNHTPTLMVQNLFADAIVEVSAQPTSIKSSFSTTVKIETKFQTNGTLIGGVPVNFTVTPSPSAIMNKMTISLINQSNYRFLNHPFWVMTNSTGEASWLFDTDYTQFGDFTPEGTIRVDVTADYGHWNYTQGTSDYSKFYYINGTNSPDWDAESDTSVVADPTLFSIDNQWEFGNIKVVAIDQNGTIGNDGAGPGADGWRWLRGDAYPGERDNLTLILRVYNMNTTSAIPNVPVTLWLNFTGDGSKVDLYYDIGAGYVAVPSPGTGITINTPANGQIKLQTRIDGPDTAPKYMKVTLNAYANFSNFASFAYLNGTENVGQERLSYLNDTNFGTPEINRGFQINPRYTTGDLSSTITYSDNDTYGVGFPVTPTITNTDTTIRRGNWINLKFQVYNDTTAQGLANAEVNFTNLDAISGLILSVDTGKYSWNGSMGWYKTDASGFIEVNVSTNLANSPKSLSKVNITANVSLTSFRYINVSATEQYAALNGTFKLDLQYVNGTVTATTPVPNKVPSGGSNITLTFEVKDPAGNLVPEVRVQNFTTTNSTGIFALYYSDGGAWENVNHTEHNYTITFTGATYNGSGGYWYLDKGNITFTIDPTTNSTPTEIPTPEGDYYLKIMANFTDDYDKLPYLNGTGSGNNETGISSTFIIQEEKTLSITITGTSPSLGQADGFYLVKRGVTQISISGSYVSSTGTALPGPVRIGWNDTNRQTHTEFISGVSDIPVLGDGSFFTTITITTASNMPVGNITIFADNSTVLNKELGQENNITAEAITYAKIIIVSDLSFDSGPSSNRAMVFVGQNSTISASLADDNGTALNPSLSAVNIRIRAWDGSSFVTGIDFLSPLTTGDFSADNFTIPDDYAQDTITVVLNVSSTVHYYDTSSQSLVINVYRDVKHGSTSGPPNDVLAYGNDSGYAIYDIRYNADSGTVANDGTVEIYNGTVTIEGWVFDQADRPLTSAYDNYANNISVLLWNATNQWWANYPTNSTGGFSISFNNTGSWLWDLANNGSWTFSLYFITENGTAIPLQNITIAYYMVDFSAPVNRTQMVQGSTTISEGGVVYGAVTLYVNATDPGPADNVIFSGIANDALDYRIDNGAWIPVNTKYNATSWAIAINADATTYDATDSHTIYLNVTDKNGNSLFYTWTFLVDNTAPNVTVNQAAGFLVIGTANITFILEENTSVTGFTALDSSTILFDIDSSGSRQNGAANFSSGTSTLTLTINATELSGESHNVAVWVNDSAGNQGTLSFNFKIDATAPSISNWGTQANGSTVYIGLYTISITITDPGDGSGINNNTILAYVDGNTTDTLTSPSYSASSGYYETIWNTTAYAAGAHILTVVASDLQGNQEDASLSLALVTISSPEAQGTTPDLTWIGYLGSASGEEVNIRVEDPTESGSIIVEVVSDSGSITLTLSESEAGSGIFTGLLSFSLQSSDNATGQIQVAPGDTVRIAHIGRSNDTRAFSATWYGGKTGSISLDKTSYRDGDTANITITDLDGNLDPNMAELLTVTVWSNSSISELPIVLQETGPDTGVFTGQIKFVKGDATTGADPEEKKIGDGDLIRFTYGDTMNDTGTASNVVVYASASVETSDGGGDGGGDTVSSILLVVVLGPLALGGGIGVAVLFERLRETYFSD